MSPVHIIEATEGGTTALAVQSIQKQSLDKCLVGSPEERGQALGVQSGGFLAREAHGRALADKFVHGVAKIAVKFIRELEPEIREVRQDFLDKPKNELICGVRTFTEYCDTVLGYSIRHIDRVLEGHNPFLSDGENEEARQRKAKRELNAKVKRNQNALPIRKKTNAEVLAETHAEKVEEKKVDVLQKQVAVLTTKLQAASTKSSPVPESQAKDITKIHASEVKALESEIKKLKGSVQKLTVAYETLRKDAIALATLGSLMYRSKTGHVKVHDRSEKFLQKHGETVGGAL
jgi:hypothetical protein